LLKLNPAKVNPLSPENHLIFATGPVAGGNVWGSSRYGVFTKSPLTGFYAESYAGGKVAEAMDATGFDAIVLTGAIAEPSVMIVEPEGVTFHPAGEIWGLDTITAGNLCAFTIEAVKAKLLTDYENRLTLFDTLILCRFFRDIYDWELLGWLIDAATGLSSGKTALRKIAADVTDLVRRFNLREGLTKEDDDLPPGIYNHDLDGKHRITKDELHSAGALAGRCF
jgi:aldehyde:ferredoxin oxidoreductase